MRFLLLFEDIVRFCLVSDSASKISLSCRSLHLWLVSGTLLGVLEILWLPSLMPRPKPAANSSGIVLDQNNAMEKKKFAGLTYIPGLFEQLAHNLKKFEPNLTLAPRPPEKVARLFSDMKEELRPGQCSCVVYGIPCNGCNDWYYGETSWTVDNRCKFGHKKDLNNMEKNPRKTALVHHAYTKNHQFDFDNKKVMKSVRSKRTLKIHEVNQIILNEHRAVNFKSDAEHVSPEFYNLIKQSVKTPAKNKKPKLNQKVNLASMFEENT